jgi:hypothetical protein
LLFFIEQSVTNPKPHEVVLAGTFTPQEAGNAAELRFSKVGRGLTGCRQWDNGPFLMDAAHNF